MKRTTSCGPSSFKDKTPALQRSVSFGASSSKKLSSVIGTSKTDRIETDDVPKEDQKDKDQTQSIPQFSLLTELTKAEKLSKYGKTLMDLPDDDPSLVVDLDPEEFIKDLKRLDPNHWDPLPTNIMWAWAEVDKKGNGKVSRRDIYRLIKKYNAVVENSTNVLKIIKKCDRNNDKILDAHEIHEVLMLATGKEVTASDSTWVMARLEAMAKASTHGGYDSTMTSDPLIVSRAVFEWWWLRQDNRGAFYRRIQDARTTIPQTGTAELTSTQGKALSPSRDVDLAARKREAELAASVLQVDVDALNMDCICFDDMVASRKSAMALDLHAQGLALLKSVEDKVQKACLPLGQGLVGSCAIRR